MKLDMAKIATSVMVGGADEALIYWDEKTARTKPFQNATDIGRAAMVLAGYGLQAFMPRYGALGDTMATAAIPLLTKSVVTILRNQGAAAPITRVRTFTPRRRVGFPGTPMTAGQDTKPEFEGKRSY